MHFLRKFPWLGCGEQGTRLGERGDAWAGGCSAEDARDAKIWVHLGA